MPKDALRPAYLLNSDYSPIKTLTYPILAHNEQIIKGFPDKITEINPVSYACAAAGPGNGTGGRYLRISPACHALRIKYKKIKSTLNIAHI